MASYTHGPDSQHGRSEPEPRRSERYKHKFRRLAPRIDISEQRLVRTIEGEIIPRLMLAHQHGREREEAETPRAIAPTVEDVDDFVRLVLAFDDTVARSYVAAMSAGGVPLETIFLDLMAPAARTLGDLWKEDLCDFTDVTIGMARLQQMLRELGPAFQREGAVRPVGRRALLVPAPDEQHTFGMYMVEEFFRRAGWEVRGESTGSIDTLTSLVRAESYAVVGLSLSCARGVDALASAIRALRRASVNRRIGVLVGGQIFSDHPQLIALVGADASALDARHAVIQAEHLLGLREAIC